MAEMKKFKVDKNTLAPGTTGILYRGIEYHDGQQIEVEAADFESMVQRGIFHNSFPKLIGEPRKVNPTTNVDSFLPQFGEGDPHMLIEEGFVDEDNEQYAGTAPTADAQALRQAVAENNLQQAAEQNPVAKQTVEANDRQDRMLQAVQESASAQQEEQKNEQKPGRPTTQRNG